MFKTHQFETFGTKWMMFFMLRVRENFEILYSVIKAIMVNVMHSFAFIKFSTKMFFHNQSMFRFPFSCFRYFYLPIKSIYSSIFSSRPQRPKYKHTQFPSFSRFFSIHSGYAFMPAGFSFSRSILLKHSLSQFFSGLRAEWMAFLETSLIRVSHKELLYAI